MVDEVARCGCIRFGLWNCPMPDPVKVQPIIGPLVAVQYPHRKTPDLYVALNGQPVFCAQCSATFPVDEFPAHVQGHDSRRRRGK